MSFSDKPVLLSYFHAIELLHKRFPGLTPKEFLMWLVFEPIRAESEKQSPTLVPYRRNGSPINDCSMEIMRRRINEPSLTDEDLLVCWSYSEDELQMANPLRWITYSQLLERWKRLGLDENFAIATIKRYGIYEGNVIRFHLSFELNETVENIRESLYLVEQIERIEQQEFPSEEDSYVSIQTAINRFLGLPDTTPMTGEARLILAEAIAEQNDGSWPVHSFQRNNGIGGDAIEYVHEGDFSQWIGESQFNKYARLKEIERERDEYKKASCGTVAELSLRKEALAKLDKEECEITEKLNRKTARIGDENQGGGGPDFVAAPAELTKKRSLTLKESQINNAKLPRPRRQHPKRGTVRDWWNKWQGDKTLFANKSKFVDVMQDKTGITRPQTIYGWMKKWEEESRLTG